MLRWIPRLLLAVLLAVVLLAIGAWLTLRASLPEIDGSQRLAGLTAPVSIERDDHGIPTITASNRADLAFATGYAHAQDRFFQMDLIRRRAAGELSELVGPATIEVDKANRLHRFRARARAVIEQSSAADRALLEHYANGVNAGLASLAAKPFEYFLLRSTPEPWRPEDSLLVVYSMFIELNDSRAGNDVRRGLAQSALPRSVYDWLYPQGTTWDAPILGEAVPALPIPAADQFRAQTVHDDVSAFTGTAEPAQQEVNGSNNWVVSGALTSTGRALVSNDMHLGLAVPNIWYRARLIQTGDAPRDVTGVSLPGTPFIVTGSNTHVAWAFTNSYGDWSDAVLLRAGSRKDTYVTPDGERPFDVHVEKIKVKNAPSIDYAIRETIWGPVDDRETNEDGEIAVSWIAHYPQAINLRAIDLETVKSLDAALKIANTIGIPPQNFVAGDAEGNIGWTIAGQIPLRLGAMTPVDWSETPGWQGWLSPDEYPRVINPANGRIWTANARVVNGDALALLGDGGYDLGARARQVRDQLFARDRFEPGDMLAIQLDDRALFLARWQALLLQTLDKESIASNPELAEFRTLVAHWIPKADPASVGYRLVRGFRLYVQQRVFNILTAAIRNKFGESANPLMSTQFEGPLWQLVTQQPAYILPPEYTSWHALLVAAVQDNIDYYKKVYGSENAAHLLARRTWGERNTAMISHPLSGVLPGLSAFLDMPHDPLPGDSNMPRVLGPDFGASERFSVAPGDEAHGLMQMPTGQSGHPLSKFYRKGHEDWVHGRPSPFLPGPTRHTLELRPA